MTKKEFITFIRFLKRNQIFPQYFRNCKGRPLHWIGNNLSPGLLIIFGFDWNSAPEGCKFWSEKSTKWTETLREKIKHR